MAVGISGMAVDGDIDGALTKMDEMEEWGVVAFAVCLCPAGLRIKRPEYDVGFLFRSTCSDGQARF